MKRGFTLIELLGVIMVIAVLSLLVFPLIMNQFKKNRSQISDVTKELIEEGARTFVEKDPNTYLKTDGNVYCISLNRLVDSNDLVAPILDPSTGLEIPLTHTVNVTVKNGQFYSEYVGEGSCTEVKN